MQIGARSFYQAGANSRPMCIHPIIRYAKLFHPSQLAPFMANFVRQSLHRDTTGRLSQIAES